MTRHHNINGNIVPFTAAEETARDTEEAAIITNAPATALATLRDKRNRLLSATDYLALSDNTLTLLWQHTEGIKRSTNGKDTVAKCENATFPTKP